MDPVPVPSFGQTDPFHPLGTHGPGFKTGIVLGGDDFRAMNAWERPTEVFVSNGFVVAAAVKLGMRSERDYRRLEAKHDALVEELAAVKAERDGLAGALEATTGLRTDEGWQEKLEKAKREAVTLAMRDARDQVIAARARTPDGKPFRFTPMGGPDSQRAAERSLEPVPAGAEGSAG